MEAKGQISFKDSDVCMTLFCSCGHEGHYDGEFFLYYACPKCGAKYSVDNDVALLPLSDEQAVEIGTYFFKTDQTD